LGLHALFKGQSPLRNKSQGLRLSLDAKIPSFFHKLNLGLQKKEFLLFVFKQGLTYLLSLPLLKEAKTLF
jgi:hypothetical protein